MAFVFIGYSLCMGNLKLKDLPDHYQNPVLALELVSKGSDIDKINSAGNGEARVFIFRAVETRRRLHRPLCAFLFRCQPAAQA